MIEGKVVEQTNQAQCSIAHSAIHIAFVLVLLILHITDFQTSESLPAVGGGNLLYR